MSSVTSDLLRCRGRAERCRSAGPHATTGRRKVNPRRGRLSPALDLLNIDDFGLKAMTMTQAEDFCETVAERHRPGSTVVTPNRFYSVSARLSGDREAHYGVLERRQHGDGHLTERLV